MPADTLTRAMVDWVKEAKTWLLSAYRNFIAKRNFPAGCANKG